ncbi:MAG: magnesium and cobalt transport protein CorA [Actinomycetes bacterium]
MIEVKCICVAGHLVFDQTQHQSDPVDAVGSRGHSDDLATLQQAVAQAGTESGSFVWVAATDPTTAELNRLAGLFKLPDLQIADAANPHQRPKIETAGDGWFIVFKTLDYIDETSDIETKQMSVFVGHGYAITVADGTDGNLDWVLPRLAVGDELLQFGSAAILHAVLDKAADDYLRVADEVSKDIEEIEVQVFSPGRHDNTEAIYLLKRENLEIRRAITPLLSNATNLAHERLPDLPAQLRPYFRDIGDHALRAGDIVDANDSLLLTMLMAATARVDLQQNADMRKISAWVSIGVVPTMIAGIFGMNFDYMPQLHYQWGYPAVLASMALVALFMFTRFKKSGWL